MDTNKILNLSKIVLAIFLIISTVSCTEPEVITTQVSQEKLWYEGDWTTTEGGVQLYIKGNYVKFVIDQEVIEEGYFNFNNFGNTLTISKNGEVVLFVKDSNNNMYIEVDHELLEMSRVLIRK